MILKESKLDQVPSNVQIVDSRGFATRSLTFFLVKIINKLVNNDLNVSGINDEVSALSNGITTSITVVDTSLVTKTLNFENGILKSIT